MKPSTPGTDRLTRAGGLARALAVGCLVAGLWGCDDGAGPGALPFGRIGSARIEVAAPLSVDATGLNALGQLRQRITWSSDGPWQLTEEIRYRDLPGDRTTRRSGEDAGTLARRYAEWIARVNAGPVRLVDNPELRSDLIPTCLARESVITVTLIDAQRKDSLAWTRCGTGQLGSLSSEAGPDSAAASRVPAAATLLRDATLSLDRAFLARGGYAYVGSLPFGTLARGEDVPQAARGPLVIPRIIEDPATWTSFWAQFMTGTLPKVDFATDVVLVGAVGTRPEAGDSIEVRRVLTVDFGTQISLYEQRPGNFCTPAPRAHAPYHIVIAPLSRAPRPIFFTVENIDTITCG
jgi:hypothetical protein